MKVYLAGPIAGCSDAQCNNWRQYAKRELPLTIDPMRRDYRGKEDANVQEIVELDKLDIQSCDAVLANCPFPSVGTSMEIFYAHQLGKKIICVVPNIHTASPWLKYHATKLVTSVTEAIPCLL